MSRETARKSSAGKKITSVMLAFMLAALMIPTSAFALNEEEVVDDGTTETLPAWLVENVSGPSIDVDEALTTSGIDMAIFEDYGEPSSDEDLSLEGLGTAEELELEGSDIEALSDPSSDITTQAATAWKRLEGETRYDTMSSIVTEAFPQKSASKFAIIATGESFPDALAASSLAGALDAPIILTGKKSLTPQADKQLTSLGIKYAIIIGSKQALSADVEKSLAKKLGKDNIMRCYGSNRYETAYAIYQLGAKVNAWSNVAFIATGNNFPDALSAGPIAFATASPIFLYNTASKTFDPNQLKALKSGQFKKIILLGSSSVLPESIRTQLGSLGGKSTCYRIAGSDRYLTSYAVAEFGIGTGILGNGTTSNYAALATGTNFPDALSGAALCGRVGAPLYLVHDSPQGRVGLYRSLARSVYHGSLSKGYVLGSDRAVAASILSKAKGLGSPSSKEQQVVDLVNKERAKAGLSALKAVPIMQGVGDIRADELVIHFYPDHTRPYVDGSGNRLLCFTAFEDDLEGNAVLPVGWMGENIAWGQPSAAVVMNDWMNSPGHRANILNSKYKYIGVGYELGANGRPYWVQMFAG